MSHVFSRYLCGIALTLSLFNDARAEIPSAPSEAIKTEQLQKELENLKASFDHLEKKLANAKPQESSSNALTPKGYFAVPNSNTFLKLSGFVKIEAINDFKQRTGDAISVGALAIEGDSTAANKGHLNVHPRMSRLTLETLSTTSRGDLKTTLEFDFFGAYPTTTTNATTKSGEFHPRLRKAFGEFAGLLIGHENSNFLNVETMCFQIYTDVNGLSGGGLRQPQIRYTYKASQILTAAFSLERPVVDYIDSTGAKFGNADRGNGKTSVPDAIVQVRLDGTKGHIAFHGLLRQLQVKDTSLTSSYNLSKKGYALGVSGKFYLWEKNNFYGRWVGGPGIGRYIFEIDGYSMIHDLNNRRVGLISANSFIVGYEHNWTDAIKTHLGACVTYLNYPGWAPMTNNFNKKLTKYLFNIVWKPVPKLGIGLEGAYLERKTCTASPNRKGTGQRLTLSFTYQF